MVKNFITFTIPSFIAWLKRNRRIKPENKPVKINLGSGLAVYKGWYNIDANFNIFISKLPVSIIKYIYHNTGAKNWFSLDDYIYKLKNHIYIHHRLEYGIPFDDNSVDYVYSSHFLEHLFKEHAEKMIKESLRVLKPGGIVRICVPDLVYALNLYYSGQKEKALKYFFPDSKSDYYSRHQYLYDFEMLKEILERFGFINITKCSFRKGNTPDIEFLDCREEETLYVEATK